MTAYQFSQSWLSKLNDKDHAPTAFEFAHLRDYLKGLDDGTISLFNPSFTNPLTVPNGGTGRSTLTSGSYLKGAGTSLVTLQAVPIPIADGGTNSTTALGNGVVIISSGGKLIEGVATVNSAGYVIGTTVQYVQANQTSTKTTTSTSYVTTDLTASITPKATSHVIKITFSGEMANPVGGSIFVTLQRSTTELAQNTSGFADVGSGTLALLSCLGVAFVDTPATTSSTTYIVKFRTNTGTATWNANAGTMNIILEEIAQ